MKKLLSLFLGVASMTTLSFGHCAVCDKKSEEAHATVGEPAPEFVLKSGDGSVVSLSSLKGQEVVLEWVNFGCPFVKKHYSAGHMQALQRKYTDEGVTWLIISSANPEHATFQNSEEFQAAADKHKANASYTLVDESGKVGHVYNAKTTPNMYVIDKEGILAYAGAIDSVNSTKTADIAGAENYVAAALDALLAGEKVETPETKPYGCSVKY